MIRFAEGVTVIERPFTPCDCLWCDPGLEVDLMNLEIARYDQIVAALDPEWIDLGGEGG